MCKTQLFKCLTEAGEGEESHFSLQVKYAV